MRPQNGQANQMGLSEIRVSCQTLNGLAQSINVRPEKIITALLALLAISGMDGRAQGDAGVAPGVQATQEDEKTIRVVVPGKFVVAGLAGVTGINFSLQVGCRESRVRKKA